MTWARTLLMAAVGLLLTAAVWWQRDTIGEALDQMSTMSSAAIAIVIGLAAFERLIRADLFRRLLGDVSLYQGITIHDVGAAADKGIPLGGPLALALRWSIARDCGVSTPRFSAAFIAYGVFAGFSLWGLPAIWLGVEVAVGSPGPTEIAGFTVITTVLVGSVAFWALLLGSDRAGAWLIRQVDRLWAAVSRRVALARRIDAVDGVIEMRDAMRTMAAGWFGPMARILGAHIASALILLVALREFGVGPELGTVEFARIYFVVTLLGSFVPTPGGVGVIEAGMTAALVEAGVDTASALAGVLVYRLLTYVVPIVLGAILYAVWRLGHRDGPVLTAAPDDVHPDDAGGPADPVTSPTSSEPESEQVDDAVRAE